MVLSYSLDELPEVAQEIVAAIESPVLLFRGEMGAGKTTLIKAICLQLHVLDLVSSPTFSLVNEYETTMGDRVYHFDFYRIKTEEEAQDVGVDDYLHSQEICLIEWPEKIANLLPETVGVISIKMAKNGTDRVLEFLPEVDSRKIF